MVYKETGKKPTAAKRLSMLTPDGLRRRVLDAIPTWEKWNRVLRQVAVLLPTHGDIDAIAEALEMTSDSLEKVNKKNPDFKKFLEAYASTGEYPVQESTGIILKHSHLVEQLANESSVIALIKLERSNKSNLDQKIVEDAGWYLNIKHDSEKYKQYVDHNTTKYRSKLEYNAQKALNGNNSNGSGLQQFKQTIDPEELSPVE